MASKKTAAEAVRSLVRRERIRFINLQFTDIWGTIKSVTVPSSQLEDLLRGGVWFDGSSVEGFARIAESDMYLRPDLATFNVIPWERGEDATARVICDVLAGGKPFDGDPRHVLTEALREAEAMGYRYITAPECEFFLFKLDGQCQTLPHDRAGYFDYHTDEAYHVRKDMVNALQEFGMRVEASHHEVAVGQHEINFRYDDALRAADNTVTFKLTLKTVAARHHLLATFMPKPVFGINGSGMHTNQSLFSIRTGRNVFGDPRGENGLSTVARQFIAGQLAHARGMCAVLAPLVNSYKRLVPGYEAPVYISWGRVNRSALIRIPQVAPGRSETVRAELRCPDPSCNPYLAFAVMLRCGLDGIRRKLVPPAPTEENLYLLDAAQRRRSAIRSLPGSLAEALDEFEKDEVVKAALGPHIAERFLEAKRRECDESRLQVTPWEIEKYLTQY